MYHGGSLRGVWRILLARAPVSLVGHAGQVSRTSLRAYHPPQVLSIFTTLSDGLEA